MWIEAIAAVVLAIGHILVQTHAPESFMDEIFHVPQTQAYCSGNWTQWDPKITTPPGLYILGASFATIPFHGIACDVATLRLLNLIFAWLLLLLLGRMLRPVAALQLWSLPISFIFYFLYYTDTLSTLLVLSALYTQVFASKWWWMSPFLGLASICVRQTNIAWCLFLAMHPWSAWLQNKPPFTVPFSRAIYHQCAWAAVGGIFLWAVWQNGGLVLGDAENHAVAVHGAQMNYIVVITSLAYAAVLPVAFGQQIRQLTLPALGAAVIFSGLITHLASLDHPFLQADNRHWMFTFWRVWLRQSSWHRLALTPCYALGWSWMIGQHGSWTTFLWLMSTSAVLLPAPLMEIRYFIVPASLFVCLVYREERQTGHQGRFPFLLLALSAFCNIMLLGFFLFPILGVRKIW